MTAVFGTLELWVRKASPNLCAVLQDFFGGFDLVKWKLRTVTTLAGWGFNFVTRTDGTFVHGEIFLMMSPAALPRS